MPERRRGRQHLHPLVAGRRQHGVVEVGVGLDDPRSDWKFSGFSNLLKTGREIFPPAVDWDRAWMRSCMRPMTPEGPPIIGHGHMGWTMACGSSRLLAGVVAGRPAGGAGLAPFQVRSPRVVA